ncbi:MAG: AAA family ATPase [Cellulomonas sp.]|uniref:AAA family ATPase n=1 Tax=Cellulomonas sp. TaxID=40001 RepID=UPI002584F28B|nr:AAA family ATPase [Cellulomonas sp.]MCR6646970.1 AAA family ATPase [Cellulomonas sp.]MCR6706226.1 AAA family ATPase [Cellulomonas sp.]
MIETMAVEGYRSLRELVLPLGRLTVVTGANGTGKSGVYRALRLLAECALGGAVGAVAREGGLRSTLWAGPEHGTRRRGGTAQGTVRARPVALRLGFASPQELGYAVDLGLPQDGGSPFMLDPEIKVETIWSGPLLRPATTLAERRGPAVRVRDDEGTWQPVGGRLRPYDSMLSEVVDPTGAPEVVAVRERLRGWRFYDHLRTDADAPARQVRVGTRTTALAHDGRDLAAALETARELGRGDEIDEYVERAFPGARAVVRAIDGRFALELHRESLLRPLEAGELSDGTLRYLLWVAALLTPRPPELMVLNEPETSLHPEVLPALAQLVRRASRDSQVVVVTHSDELAAALRADARDGLTARDVHDVELLLENGETVVAGREGPLDQPAWQWPSR